MSKIPFDIGYYEISEAIIKTYDGKNRFNLANFITEVAFSESVEMDIMTGYCVVVDSYGLLDKLPVKGEEILTLTYSDFFEEEITQDFFIHNVSGIVPFPQSTGVSYVLHFVSPTKFLSDRTKIQKYYKGNISDIAKKIHDEYLVSSKYSTTPTTIEETTGEQSLIIPSLTPLDAIKFLRRRAYSTTSKSSNFLFFQTRKGLNFCTLEKLLEDNTKDALTFTYNPNNLTNISARSSSMNSVIDFSVAKTPSTIDEMNLGSMVAEIVTVDPIEKQYIPTVYSYKNSFEDYTHTDKDRQFIHTDRFVEDFFPEETPPKSYLVYTDSTKPEQNYANILGPRQSNKFYTKNIMIDIEIYGRININCGDMIFLELPKLENIQGDKQIHTSLSGFWLIHSLSHQLTPDKDYRIKALLVKDSYRLRV